jgi:hypothetical protein
MPFRDRRHLAAAYNVGSICKRGLSPAATDCVAALSQRIDRDTRKHLLLLVWLRSRACAA